MPTSLGSGKPKGILVTTDHCLHTPQTQSSGVLCETPKLAFS